MPDFTHWSIFFGTTVVLLLIPGPSVMYVVARGVDQGYRGAVLSSIGLALGDLLQVICTVAGLSALLASSDAVFAVLKYAGAVYLVLLGTRRLIEKDSLAQHETPAQRHSAWHSLVLQGFFALNPKTALFFVAFFPQFVSQNAGPTWLQLLLFGCAFVVLGFITNSIYGCVGGKLGSFGRRSRSFSIVTRWATGAALIAMGVAAALAPGRHAAASHSLSVGQGLIGDLPYLFAWIDEHSLYM